MKVLFLQHGNYAEAHDRMLRGEAETYRDQFQSVAFVADLARQGHQVTTIAICEEEHDRELASGLHSVGLRRRQLDAARVASLLDGLKPDVLICRTPHPAMLQAAAARRLPTLPCFADLFAKQGLRGYFHRRALRLALAAPTVPCVANHSLNASRSVVAAGLATADRVVPWDWSRMVAEPEAKTAVADPAAPRLFFAGKMATEKGIGDVIAALAPLRQRGIMANLSIAGQGDTAPWMALAESLGVAGAVHFLGRIANTEVRQRMAEHDIVVVASRHGYPEGLPNTIYEGLASRSALILSDHPAFVGRVAPDQACLAYPAANPQALAAAVERLCTIPGLYTHLSQNAPEALARLYVGLEWKALIALFLADPANREGWVEHNALKALGLAG